MQRTAKTLSEALQAAKGFVGLPIENKSTGLVATVSNTNLSKMSSQSASQKSNSLTDHSLAIANLDQLFACAALDQTHPDKRGEPTIIAIHRYIAPMRNSQGQLLTVKMTVKETASSKVPNPIYSVETRKPALGAFA
ncbi:hypothetical protein AXK11_03975 [Cephaloticoccus primus]|uniref:Large polyvalent protein-associated domain-containing protein n=1 Tax=Cephaloticoccus primus TaxID=1548207 RepID=A0A139SPS2_9BACT|nr:hypothetical protein [Cephaloticoccus primus]KXU36522.1 hypothetical protein AXK11_03975 [Cephaloticoccus primus]